MDLLNRIPEPIRKAILEALRLAIFTGVAFLVAFGIDYVASVPETQTTIVLTLILRFVDKYLHEYGKENDLERVQKGLTQF